MSDSTGGQRLLKKARSYRSLRDEKQVHEFMEQAALDDSPEERSATPRLRRKPSRAGGDWDTTSSTGHGSHQVSPPPLPPITFPIRGGIHGIGGTTVSTDSSSLSGSREGSLHPSQHSSTTRRVHQRERESHIRFRPRIPFIPLILPHPVSPDIDLIARSCIAKLQTDQSLSQSQPSSELELIPSIHFPHCPSPFIHHDSSSSAYPDGLILPKRLLTSDQLRPRFGEWEKEALLYGQGEDGWRTSDPPLPDLFSRCHDIASPSNGRKMIVTFYVPDPSLSPPCATASASTTQDPHPLEIYVSPGLAVDMIGLAETASDFKSRTDHLLRPLRVYRESGCLPVEDGVGVDEGRREIGPGMDGLPARLINDPFEPSLKSTLRQPVIQPDDLSYILSMSAAAALPISRVALCPTVHERWSGRYGVRFHTFQRGTGGLYDPVEGEEDEVELDRDVGYDMRSVCALTGGLGCTFSYTLYDAEPYPRVQAEVWTSFQFVPGVHEPWLGRWSDEIYRALRPSLLVPLIVKREVEKTMRLPERKVARVGVRTQGKEPSYRRFTFRGGESLLPWRGFLGSAERRLLSDGYVQSCRRLHERESVQRARMMFKLTTPGPKPRLQGGAVDMPATPITPVRTGLRPLLMKGSLL